MTMWPQKKRPGVGRVGDTPFQVTPPVLYTSNSTVDNIYSPEEWRGDVTPPPTHKKNRRGGSHQYGKKVERGGSSIRSAQGADSNYLRV